MNTPTINGRPMPLNRKMTRKERAIIWHTITELDNVATQLRGHSDEKHAIGELSGALHMIGKLFGWQEEDNLRLNVVTTEGTLT